MESVIDAEQREILDAVSAGERRISIPPELGYGAQDVKDPAGKVIIPANSTLIFDIKLVKVAEGTPAQPTE